MSRQPLLSQAALSDGPAAWSDACLICSPVIAIPIFLWSA
jgi:hypothetical protein